ncbi:MAG: porin family protein [Deltaproteobacteria bacterium]|nr:porin family protein [Deltaproteobacteria bacterium]MBW2417348.1 porin family protein [Deltaproteobacteria bacterium]
MGISRTTVSTGIVWTCVFLFALLLPASADAEWRLYGDFELGISTATGKTSGENIIAPQFPPHGSDSDSSPLIGMALGIESPLDQATAWNPPFGMRWPRWTLRTESEFIFLRDYEYKTEGVVGAVEVPYFTQTDTWTFMQNFLVDMPLLPLYRPITWVSKHLRGPARLPALKRVLRPMRFDVGAGVGFADTGLYTTDNNSEARESEINFAWQARAGFGYEVTRHVTLMAGYRYVDLGSTSAPLVSVSDPDVLRGSFSIDQTAHEFRAGIRVYYFEFESPWH